MAGDTGGWSQALWIPIVGVVWTIGIRLSERTQFSGVTFLSISRWKNNVYHSKSSSDHSLELVVSSLHQLSGRSDDMNSKATTNHLETNEEVGIIS
jgi:hypothetical protein